MRQRLFDTFMVSGDTMQAYEDAKLVFSSRKDGLLPLLEYIDSPSRYHRQVVIFDKIMGNAAALLSIKVGCQEVYSPLGSQLAVKTLDKYGVKYYLSEIVPYIQQANRQDMCPMEKLSIDKEPEEFYKAIKSIIK